MKKEGVKTFVKIIFAILAFIIVLGAMGYNILDNTQNNVEGKYTRYGLSVNYDSNWKKQDSNNLNAPAIYNESRKILLAYSGKLEDSSVNLKEMSLAEVYSTIKKTLEPTMSQTSATNKKESYGFKTLKSPYYYAFFQIKLENYTRAYLVFDNEKKELYMFNVGSEQELNSSDEKQIIDILKTIEV